MKPKIGLVLSGGGMRGVAQLGALQALEELGIRPGMISGVSAGAVAGAFYAAGYPPREILEIIKKGRIFSLSNVALKKQGLFSMKPFAEIFAKHFPHDSFRELGLPVTAAATDLVKGEIAYFTSGSLSLSLKASSCIPFMFQPVQYRGTKWVDGGVLNNFPVEPLEGICEFIVGVYVNSVKQEQPGTHLFDIVERSFHLAMNQAVQDKFTRCDLLIAPPGMSRFSMFSVNHLEEIYDYGYRYALSLEKRIGALALSA